MYCDECGLPAELNITIDNEELKMCLKCAFKITDEVIKIGQGGGKIQIVEIRKL